ncbi:MAG: IS110 family transposase [bacterium]|nr:IS110 family transposase [Hyphomicrobiales bacterium]MCP5021566.1 IS110 family transposase [bacterium]
MRFYTNSHMHSCGIDLHAKTMYLCILDREGEILLHQNIKSHPEPFLAAVAPFREDLVVAVECMFTWYWLADLCRNEGIEFVLGHALYMKAIHGGKAKNDKLDAYKIAALLRGGTLPKAYVYPPEMRATRDLLRRRLHLVRRRGNLLAHIQNTHHQYNLPVPPAKIAYKANRVGVAEAFGDPDARKSMEVDFGLIAHYDDVIRDLELHLERRVKQQDAHAYYRLRSVPGIGKVLALTILYEIHDIQRFPRVQDFLSYARLVKCEHSSAGKKLGSGGAKIGNVHLKWAFSEAAVLFLRKNPEGQKHLRRVAGRHGKAKALSILAAKLGRAVYLMLSKDRVFEMKRFLATT